MSYLHEQNYALGFVQLCVPGAINNKNSKWGKSDNLNYPGDLMSDRDNIDFIDRKRKEYYRHSYLECEIDFKNIAFFRTYRKRFQLQPRAPSCKLTTYQLKYNHQRSLDYLERLNFK